MKTMKRIQHKIDAYRSQIMQRLFVPAGKLKEKSKTNALIPVVWTCPKSWATAPKNIFSKRGLSGEMWTMRGELGCWGRWRALSDSHLTKTMTVIRPSGNAAIVETRGKQCENFICALIGVVTTHGGRKQAHWCHRITSCLSAIIF